MKLYDVTYYSRIDRQEVSEIIIHKDHTLEEVCSEFAPNMLKWELTTEKELKDYLGEISTCSHQFVLSSGGKT